uniref:CD99 molecule (Xg blood group) n=1 Tax=Ursus maritimus TaxID=29073 RepID=A0A452UYH8_URSMA
LLVRAEPRPASRGLNLAWAVPPASRRSGGGGSPEQLGELGTFRSTERPRLGTGALAERAEKNGVRSRLLVCSSGEFRKHRKGVRRRGGRGAHPRTPRSALAAQACFWLWPVLLSLSVSRETCHPVSLSPSFPKLGFFAGHGVLKASPYLTVIALGLRDPRGDCGETGQDFDLSDALGDNDKKPTAPPKRPSADDDGFSLEDALGGGGNNDPVPPNPPKPKPHPNPNQPGSSGGFSDSDLIDGAADGGGGGGGGGGGQKPDGGEQADSPGVVPGIIGAVVVAVAGAISSFIAYQKKKLCFKENADQGEPSPKNQESTSADQTVQWSLLEK